MGSEAIAETLFDCKGDKLGGKLTEGVETVLIELEEDKTVCDTLADFEVEALVMTC